MGIEWVTRRKLVTTGSGEPVLAAARQMREHELGAVLVVDDGKLVGIFTERDAVTRVIASGRDPATLTVGEVATKVRRTIPVDADLGVCLRVARESGLAYLPVVDAAGLPVGVVSIRDFLDPLSVRSAETDVVLDELGELRIDLTGWD